MNNKCIKEDNDLFKDILERNYFQKMRENNNSYEHINFEIILNQLCRSNCEYCYLKRHQKGLFPTSLYNEEKIINNFQLLINWYIENNFVCDIDIFSAEWLTTSLRKPVLDILYNSFKNIPFHKRPKAIINPDNCAFINDDKIVNEVQHYIDLFNQIGIRFIISASIDGKMCDDGRTQYPDEFYIKLFNFLNKNGFLCHPMVSAHNIKNWIKNYEWWFKNAPNFISKNLMMLEVRNEDWQEKDIKDLINFCDFLLDFKLKYYYNNDIKKFATYIFGHPDNPYHYSPERMNFNDFDKSFDTINCSFRHSFIVRAVDLSINLCHRLTYEHLLLGNFIVENNKIIDIENGNPALSILKTHLKRSILPHCEKCPLVGVCIGFCHGNSYENYKNLLVPTKQVCDMYKAKIAFLIKKYETIGLFKVLEEDNENIIASKEYKEYLFNLKHSISQNI